MRMTKLTLAALCTALCLTACGTDTGSSQSGLTPAETTTTAAETTTSAAETTTSAAATTTVTTTAAATTASAAETTITAAGSEIVGDWLYQQRDQTSAEEWAAISLGSITINADGTYTYEPVSGDKQTGKIKVMYEEYSNGDTVPFYSFTHDNGEFFISAYCNQNEKDVYYLGNGGEARIVRND